MARSWSPTLALKGLPRERARAAFDLIKDLCAPECAGRAPGTPGSKRAAARIVREFEAIGLEARGTDGYLQRVTGCGGANILGRIPGRGPHADRIIVVGAHYDHLGDLGPGELYAGADDNAAAVAILCDLARGLAGLRERLGRQVVIVAFDAEEPPYFLGDAMGSVHLVRSGLLPIERVDMMLCMDLVGHALGGPDLPSEVRRSIFVLGAERSEGTMDRIARVGAAVDGIFMRPLSADMIPALSDYYAFDRAGVPFLFFTCARWEHYHQTTDTPDRLDYAKILATADLLQAFVLDLSSSPDPRFVPVPSSSDDQNTLQTMATLMQLAAPSRGEARALARLAAELGNKLVANGKLDGIQRGMLRRIGAEMEALLER